MDKTTAYTEALSAATSAVAICLALLPDPAWGDDEEPEEREEREMLERVQGELSGGSIPFGAPGRRTKLVLPITHASRYVPAPD